MPSANDRLFDLDVRHQVGLQRFAGATVRKMLVLLTRVEADIVKQIAALSWEDVSRESAKRQRLEKMLEGIRLLITEAYAGLTGDLRADLLDLAKYEGEYQAQSLAQVITEFDAGFSVQPTAEQLRAAVLSRPFQGRVLKEWGKDLDEASFKRVRDAIRIGYVEGESVPNIVKRIRGTKALRFKDGILEISRRDAEGLVRTAVTHTAMAAKEEFWKANPDAIRGVRWSSVLDARTTPVCRARDGMIYPVGKGPRPPAHWRCRSTVIAVLDGDEAADETYQGWLAKQPVETQDEILGRAKGRLFRQGGLTLDRFVNRAGDELTLAELKVREAQAFAKAGIAA